MHGHVHGHGPWHGPWHGHLHGRRSSEAAAAAAASSRLLVVVDVDQVGLLALKHLRLAAQEDMINTKKKHNGPAALVLTRAMLPLTRTIASGS